MARPLVLILLCRGAPAAGGSGAFGAAVGLWRSLTDRLFHLEAGILATASATETQTVLVRQKRAEVGVGEGAQGEGACPHVPYL